MASSESRRRKQLEKKKKKRNDKRHQIVVVRNAGLAEKLAARAKFPVHECLVNAQLGNEGGGLVEVVISRKCASGEIAFGLFLIDSYCMGVKDCFGKIVSVSQYNDFKDNVQAKGRILRAIDPPSARRFVEDAVAYAERFGIKPHADFRAARMILGDIDSSKAKSVFEMGKDGKPFFTSGPFQSPAECQMIIAKLTAECGADGFHYIVGIDPRQTMLTDQDFDELSFDDDKVIYVGDEQSGDESDDENEKEASSLHMEDHRA